MRQQFCQSWSKVSSLYLDVLVVISTKYALGLFTKSTFTHTSQTSQDQPQNHQIPPSALQAQLIASLSKHHTIPPQFPSGLISSPHLLNGQSHFSLPKPTKCSPC